MKEQTHSIDEVAFVAEPAAESERRLKTRLSERFRSGSGVGEAYLVCARYGHAPKRKPAPCLRTEKSISDFNLVNPGGQEFGDLFDHPQSLDTIWLTCVQYQPMVTVAHPWYRRASTGNA